MEAALKNIGKDFGKVEKAKKQNKKISKIPITPPSIAAMSDNLLQGISKLEFYFIDQENASAIQARKNKISALFPSMIHDRIFNYAQKRGWIDRREVSSIDSKFYINQDFLIDEDYIRGR